MTLDEILTIGFKGKASDIHLKVGLPPMFRISGTLVALKNAERLGPPHLQAIVDNLLTDRQKKTLLEEREVDLAHGISGIGRFRINVYHQRGSLAIAARVIPMDVPNFEKLHLPKVMEKISSYQRGLVLVTGTTGSGKSSTLAAIIDHINSTRTCHIMTIEDPIEFLVRDKRSMVNQRELGLDTYSFSGALKSALRQDPDVILIGEMRDLETIETAMHSAETGHLVMSTLHTMDASETINRIVSMFEPYQQKTIRLQLASILQAVVSQRLVPTKDGKKRVPAVEVMINTPHIQELIEDESKLKELRDAIADGHVSYGMQTFDQSLMSLVKRNMVAYDTALIYASNPADFELRFKGISSSDGGKWDQFDEDSGDVDFEIER